MSNPQRAKQRPILPWHRFWVPLGGTVRCDEGGFLVDPESDYGTAANPEIVRLDDLIPEYGPLILCGEPGIGKSTELAGLQIALKGKASAHDEICCALIFREIADLADFRRHTVDTSIWQAWRGDSRLLTLIIDGVDEGLLRVPIFSMTSRPCSKRNLCSGCG